MSITAGSVVRRTLAAQVQGVLATVDPSGAPATFLMAFATAHDSATILLATPTGARKALHMLDRPRVSLLFDDRTGKLADHKDGLLVTAAGTARLLNDQLQPSADGLRLAVARNLFLEKNPNMAGFVSHPDIGLFAIKVEVYEVVKGYEKPQLWEPQWQPGTASSL
jgi:hypothetical protein